MTERVLHLITRFLDGGAERTTENTLDALQAAEAPYDLRLGFGTEYNPERTEAISERGIDTVPFRFIRHYNPLTAIFAVFEVAWYLRREHIDVIHTHSTEAGIIGRVAAWIVGTPVVIHEIHGDPITSDRDKLLNWFLLKAERLCAHVTDILIVKSERIRDTYLDRGIGTADRYRVIYHGVDISTYRDATSLEQYRAVLTVTYVGRLEEGKGLFDLLDVVARLDERSFRTLLVGEGKLRDELKREIERQDLGDSVELLGYREDVPSILAASDILALPSYREGTPRVITEALASGVPIVATKIAGIPEQVTDGKTGYLVRPGDRDTLAIRLKELLDNPNRRQLFGKHAAESVNHFDVNAAKRKYQNLYDEVRENYIRGIQDP